MRKPPHASPSSPEGLTIPDRVAWSVRTSVDRTENRLAAALRRARASGRPILDLTESNPTSAGIRWPEDALAVLADPGGASYCPDPWGHPAAREAIAATYAERGVAVDASRILLTASTSEAYALLFKLLCDPGDEVIVPQPSYPLLDHIARVESIRLSPYRLAYDGEWHVDLESLRTAIAPRSRAIVIVHPNNPTGSYIKRDELAALASTGLPVISDEVFASYPLRPDPRRAESVLELTSGAVFALGGLSKMAALPQMKLAWIALGGRAHHVREASERLELLSDTFLSVGTPVQLAAPRLLQRRHVVTSALASRLTKNLGFLLENTSATAASALRVEGGWYAVVRLPRVRSEEEWVLSFLEEDGVWMHPGHFFDFPSEAFVVVSLLTPEDAFAEGIKRMVARVG